MQDRYCDVRDPSGQRCVEQSRFMILRQLRYIKNLMFTKPKKNVVTIVGTTGVGKSQVRFAAHIETSRDEATNCLVQH